MEEYDAAEAGARVVDLPGEVETALLMTDAMARAERGANQGGRAAARAAAPAISEMYRVQTERSEDAYTINKALRRAHRTQRAEARERNAERDNLGIIIVIIY